MATSGPLAFHAVALVLLPPPHIAAVVDALRSANDKAWPRWSAHVTVLFPFGVVENLPQVAETLRSALASSKPFRIKLDKVSRFSTRDYETVHLGTSSPTQAQALWSTVIKATKHKTNGRPYVPHMTLGQTARNPDSIAFLTDKGNKLLDRHDFSWLVDSVALLRKREDQGGYMEVYAQIPLGPLVDVVPRDHTPFRTPTYYFDGVRWIPKAPRPLTSPPTSLTVATYNLLHDSAFPFSSRLSHVLDAVLESNADIMCLQESTDESISLILQDERIRQRWPWCTRYETVVMESERNVVMLAREEFGFEWVRLELGGKHKACVIARLCLLDSLRSKSIVIAGIHLTAGRKPVILDKKRDEVAKLLAYLRQHHEEDDWVVIGDVNWPSDEDFPRKDVLVDVWAETMGEGGATYDPTSNPLAAATARECRTPERYDRVFVKKGSRLVVGMEGLELFGMPGEGGRVGSDHWGLKAVFQVGDGQASQANNAAASRLPAFTPTLQLLPTNLSDDQLQELCAEKGCFPSDARNGELQNAVDILRGFLTNTSSPAAQSLVNDDTATAPSAVRLVMAPVGSFAMGYHTSDSDVDCVVIGNINPQTFWSLVRWKIHVSGSLGSVKLRRFVKDALVQMMELDVDGIKIDLQYCPATNLVECWDDLPNIPRTSSHFSLPVSALRTLNAHRDALILLQNIPSLDTFRLAHRALKLFLSHRGIVGARFGFLGGFHLAFLLARICIQVSPSATAAHLVRMFFHVYARWDWEREAVTVPIPGLEASVFSGYRRSKREPMVVLSAEKPQVNMTVNANPNSLQIMASVFATADRACEEGLSWREICGEVEDDPPFTRFIKDHKAFIKIEVNYWGNNCMKGRALTGWLESRFVGLLVQLNVNAPTVRAHLWPARFVDSSTVDDRSLNGFYLIGLSSLTPAPGEKQVVREGNYDIKSAITGTIRTFESDIRSNARFYDPNEMFVCVANVTASQLPSTIILDFYQWSDGGFDDESEDKELNDCRSAQDDEEGISSISSSAPKQQASMPCLPAAKLRTSSDVYNRLMWDPAVSKEDYVIGYEDRFKGVKETPLTSWKREVEDEAFIPFHRVVHFRRKTDNVTVWDRKTKTDLVFGSGVTVRSATQ